jgi:hypothetical protein
MYISSNFQQQQQQQQQQHQLKRETTVLEISPPARTTTLAATTITTILPSPDCKNQLFSPFLRNSKNSSPLNFFQVRLHGGGTVPLEFLKEAALDLTKLQTDVKSEQEEESLKIIFWATDGTLLNFMRWGAIVNDNDVDVSFAVVPSKFFNHEQQNFLELAKYLKRVINDKEKQRQSYIALLNALARSGIVDAPDARILKNLRQPFKPVKPKRCHIRRGFMQCRHKNGVEYDFFGTENSFVGRRGFDKKRQKDGENDDDDETAAETLKQLFFPLTKCKSYDSEFPCPKQSLKVLKEFSLDYSFSNESWKEFGGCTLFTKRKQDEYDFEHLNNILETTKRLSECGYPSLFEDRLNGECKKILKKAKINVD